MKLEEIINPSFLKELDQQQLNSLATTIREFIIKNVSKTGGHLSSNLGIVELTIALHYVFDSPTDKIFFDVGHQCYVHKILTGRAKDFSTLRQTNGLSGFQKQNESVHDVWEAGHSSTALSAGVAMAVARDLNNENYDVIPVVGDGAMLGGASLEALNHLSSLPNKVILILNDNQMSIGKVIGDASHFLSNVRISSTYNHLKQDYRRAFSKGKIRKAFFKSTSNIKNALRDTLTVSTVFDDFGIRHLGPIDGHNIKELIKALEVAKQSKDSVVVHVISQKGKGYSFAQKDISGKWHGPGPFDIETGLPLSKSDNTMIPWSNVVSNKIYSIMENDTDVVAVTPAMISGSAMERLFEAFPNRCFDVGIAEQHALTFVAGLSISKKKTFISVYSSFIQRAYDQINHDIARMNLPCFISVDRAGIVGSDGPTHHGVFDLSIFLPLPNIVYFAPSNIQEANQYIDYAFNNFDKPYFMRIPRGSTKKDSNELNGDLVYGKWLSYDYGNKLIIITYGENVNKVREMVVERNISGTVVNARFIKPMDESMLLDLASKNIPIIVYETDLEAGGLFQYVSAFYHKNSIEVTLLTKAIEDKYSIQGSIQDIYINDGIDIESLYQLCKETIDNERKN